MVVVGAALAVAMATLAKLLWEGIKRVNFKSADFYLGMLIWLVISLCSAKMNFAHLRFMMYLTGWTDIWVWISKQGKMNNAFYLFFFGVLCYLIVLGILGDMIYAKYTKAAKTSGLANGAGESPKAIKVSKGAYQTTVTFLCPGISPGEWERRKSELVFNLHSDIEKIKASEKAQCVEVIINNSQLEKSIKFDDFEDEYTSKTHSYPIGKSSSGLVMNSLTSCPHILIGGTTGMGKSTAFKQLLYSLLRDTPPDEIELKLLDLKKGIEVSDFKKFSNVQISTNEFEALETLTAVCEEMGRRYKLLESKEKKLLDPKRDELPAIVVGVDEASVIFGKTSGRSSLNETIKKAREKCEEIAKLGRAARIHLVLATQRATSSSIDTSTLDNIDGRLCFRTQSVSGSTAILGNKSGTEIPDVPGRAIWKKGTKSEMIQVPFMTDDELKERCQMLLEKRRPELKTPQVGTSSKATDGKIKLKNVSGA